MSLHKIKHRLVALGGLQTRRLVKQFVSKHGLVYFGSVDPHSDEYELVRGVTVALSHVDNHYSVGSFQNRDVTFVQRHNTISHPGKQEVGYAWLIMQFDLNQTGLPHIFIDTHSHPEIFYADLFTKQPKFKNLSSMFASQDLMFAQSCKVFGSPSDYTQISDLLSGELAEAFTQHFRSFDYEIDDDRLYLYANNAHPSMSIMQEMLKVGSWLADQIDGTKIS